MKKIRKRLIALFIVIAMAVNLVNPVMAADSENTKTSGIESLTDTYKLLFTVDLRHDK